MFKASENAGSELYPQVSQGDQIYNLLFHSKIEKFCNGGGFSKKGHTFNFKTIQRMVSERI